MQQQQPIGLMLHGVYVRFVFYDNKGTIRFIFVYFSTFALVKWVLVF